MDGKAPRVLLRKSIALAQAGPAVGSIHELAAKPEPEFRVSTQVTSLEPGAARVTSGGGCPARTLSLLQEGPLVVDLLQRAVRS